ncbi:MAG: pimeloyl-CoA dehydrogenase large subunit, partial [Chloroflexi bacterium]|nr:pimeloyl-CoA dehydrogenase large subunit [Chloroflexota bacterium]
MHEPEEPNVDYQFTESDNAFRTEVVNFIDDNWVPASASDDNPDAGFEAERAFEKRAASKGWLTMAWPEEYGGRGASHIQQMIYREEAAYRGAPGSGGQGISMVGPCLMLHGSEEQRREHLPRIANAESYWAQGFSEPGNGSDLAGLQTRAVRDGDDFVINGQKIWTSGAQHADWIHVLTRTDPEAPKHRGISYFLLDMNTPGIEVRPLINMLDEHSFNEVYFTDVRVPASNMMGEYNRGWYVAATLLDFERSGVAWSATSRKSVELMSEYAAERPGRQGGGKLIDDPGVRNGLAYLMIESEIAKLSSYSVVWMQSQELVPNHEASM